MKRDRFERQDGFAGSASSMSKTARRLRSWHSKRAGPPHPHLTANMVKLGQRRRFDRDAALCGMVGLLRILRRNRAADRLSRIV